MVCLFTQREELHVKQKELLMWMAEWLNGSNTSVYERANPLFENMHVNTNSSEVIALKSEVQIVEM